MDLVVVTGLVISAIVLISTLIVLCALFLFGRGSRDEEKPRGPEYWD